MRLSKLIPWLLLLGAFVAVGRAADTAQPARAPGRIVLAKVVGSVVAVNLTDKSERKLANNDSLTQNYAITTAAASSAILVFSNGATLTLGAETTLSIDEFLQDPFDKEVTVADLAEEPTSSTTKLNLTRGELVGNVKHLHQDKGSSFTVQTPVGAAGIRGTTFRLVFKPDASGKVFFSLQTADGSVELFKAEATGAAASVQVATGSEVTLSVEATVDATTGAITITSAPTLTGVQTTAISTQQLAAIAETVNTAVEAAKTVVIEAIQGTGAGGSGGDADEQAKKEAADKAAKEKEAADKAAADKAAADKAASDKAASDKAASDKAAADKAASDKAAADKAADQLKTNSKTGTDTNTPSNNQTPLDGVTPSTG